MYLLDTDWIIQALGDRQPALRTLDQLAGSRIFVSYITIGEIYEPAFNSANPKCIWSTSTTFSAPNTSSP